MSVARSWLTEVRADGRARFAAVLAGVALGLAVAWVHWSGLVLGGALVGLVSKNVKRGLLAGLAFGLFAWAVFAALIGSNGGLMAYLEMGRITAVSVAIPVVGSLLGSLVRGVV